MMISTRRDRVREHTAGDVNTMIDDAMRDRLFRDSTLGDRELSERIDALDREWDIERYLEVFAPALALSGIVLAAFGNRRWLALSAGVLGFLVQHAVQGWCPPLAALRASGVRTRREIEEERYALKALRGDFSGLPPDAPQNRVTRVDAALDAVRSQYGNMHPSFAPSASWRPVPDMNLQQLRVPVLVVHHEDDAYRLRLFRDMPRLMKAIADAPRKALITFRGREKHGEPCEALAHHGFNGIEADVVHAISGGSRNSGLARSCAVAAYAAVLYSAPR